MGLRAIFQHRERSELMALPYVTADINAKNREAELRMNRGEPPRVREVPEEWIKYLCMALFLVPLLMR